MELKRESGVLVSITSLSSSYGIGDLGEGAFRFADFLHAAGQNLWQILPLNPTGLEFGNSPYSSSSAFAMNPLLLSPQLLVRKGLLEEKDIETIPESSVLRTNYRAVTEGKGSILARAFKNFMETQLDARGFSRFCDANRHWLDDHTLFSAIRSDMQGLAWRNWPVPLRDRHSGGLEEARRRLYESIGCEKFIQYLCFQQWSELKAYCNDRNITIIGDIPLYVNLESADVWAYPHLFKLDEEKRPLSVSGVPPDFYSETGQLWNNPIFNWARFKEEKYSWWVERVSHNLRLFDCVRIDHFRGLARFWEVPSGATTAADGAWIQGPGEEFLAVMAEHFPSLPFIAEDLGVITEDVIALRDRFGLPGMRVFQFGFGASSSELHLPHRYVENCVAYTGTHDNETLIGWLFNSSGEKQGAGIEVRRGRRRVRQYVTCRAYGKQKLRRAVLHNLMRSGANWVIIPLQDILGLGSEARMNTPGTALGNWEWRLQNGDLNSLVVEELRSMTAQSGRGKR